LLLAYPGLTCGRNLDFDFQNWSSLAAKQGQSPSVVANTGAKVGFWRGDIKGLMDDIGALKPTIFIGVPRVFDRIYSGVLAKIQVGIAGALASDLFASALFHLSRPATRNTCRLELQQTARDQSIVLVLW